MLRAALSLLLFLHAIPSFAQLVSGPMLGPPELRDTKIWMEVTPSVKSLRLQVSGPGGFSRTLTYGGALGAEFNPVTFTVGGLEPGTTYSYKVLTDGKVTASGSFSTKTLWQWRLPAPDFSFLTGSCAYFNQPKYDRPGTPYGGDSTIFRTMAGEKAAFMLWMGDNWYTREVDYYSEWGMWYRPHRDRSLPVLQPFLKAVPHLATWDDHDFGPNNSGRNFLLRETSREVFSRYWANPSYGEGGEGVYTMYSYGDVDLFLLDDRYWRSADNMLDSVGGRPNPEKVMLGARQMSWLKNALLFSTATFKIIVCGSQVLNPASPYDKLRDFSLEYRELTDFLATYRVNGVLFMSGDRHHSEVIRVERPGTYPLFDVTVSPLTAGTHTFSGPEANNAWRVIGIDKEQNYGRFTISGARGARTLRVEFIGVKGAKLGEWTVPESALRTPSANSSN